MSPLNLLANLLRGRPRTNPDQLQAYEELLRPLVGQLGSVFARWRADLELDSTAHDLANSASIQRWEAAGLIEPLNAIEPPAHLAKSHAALQTLATDTARAAQLLSNGYRYNSSRARCDGQALMLTSEERFQTLLQSLAQQGLSVAAAAPGDAEPPA